METRSRKRSHVGDSKQSGSHAKKIHVDIASIEKYDTRSLRKRALPGSARQGTAKRMKQSHHDKSSTTSRRLQKSRKSGVRSDKKRNIPSDAAENNMHPKSRASNNATEKEVVGDHHAPMATISEKAYTGANLERSEKSNDSLESLKPINKLKRNPSVLTTKSSKPLSYSNAAKKYPRSLVETALLAQNAKKAASSKLHSPKLETLGRWWKTLLCVMSILMAIHAVYTKQPFEKECIYVNGGGFGGFWFILGQLYKLHKESEIKNYVCYSAGCLGAVSILANRTFEDLFDSALNVQTNWKNGSISRFDAVEHFVDDLLGNSSEIDVSAFSNVHILTSVPKSGGWEVRQNIAEDADHLKTLLVQTAWIPFITGDHIWHPPTGHMDGGFSRLQHPTCDIHISLPWDWKLLANTMNINMGKEEGNRYWQLGLNYDI